MEEPMADTAPDNNEGVDYEFWSRMSGWTVAEAAALLLDIDPDRLPAESEERGTQGGNIVGFFASWIVPERWRSYRVQ
jgi:hypothetical protein